MYLCTCVPVYLCTCVPVYLCTCVPVYLCTCVPVYLCTCVPVYLCTCVHDGDVTGVTSGVTSEKPLQVGYMNYRQNQVVTGGLQVTSLVHDGNVLYITVVYCAEIDQKRELVRFGKLTPPLAGRIPEMQMPPFKSFTDEKFFPQHVYPL